jgi:hypothetical protein
MGIIVDLTFFVNSVKAKISKKCVKSHRKEKYWDNLFNVLLKKTPI